METNNINTSIGCGVKDCKYNSNGCNCTLDHIHVGNACHEKSCTCCDNYHTKD